MSNETKTGADAAAAYPPPPPAQSSGGAGRPDSGANPFAGIPASDYVRDAAALALLLVSLALPWNFSVFATARIEVILITLLSVFSLAVTYLARVGVFPPPVARFAWLIRLAANLPYLILVLVNVVIDAVAGANYGGGGIGFAVAFGLAGAVLAAQPREAEVSGATAGVATGELWYRGFLGFGAVSVLLAVLSLVLIVVRPGIGYFNGFAIALLVFSILFNAAAVALLVVGILRRSEPARLAAVAIGVIVLLAIVVDMFSGRVISGGGVESLHAVGYGAFVVSALGAFAAAPPLRLAMRTPEPGASRWFGASSILFLAAAGLAAFAALATVLALASGVFGAGYVGLGIGAIVILVAFALVAIVARSMFRTNPQGTYLVVLSLVGGLLVLGVVHVVLGAVSARVGILDLVLAFGLPLAILSYLTLPTSVRAQLSAAVAAGAAARADAARAAAASAAAASAAGATGSGASSAAPPSAAAPSAPPAAPAATPAAPAYTAEQASDPATDPAVLYQIAQSEPALRPLLAANPSAYPALLEWLGQLGDKKVDAALRKRAAQSSS